MNFKTKIFATEQKNQINTFYSIRFFLFLIIFITHTIKFNDLKMLEQPTLAVSGFIILSGFLNGYVYMNKELKIKDSFKFAKKRIKKIYLVHVFALLLTVIQAGLFSLNNFNSFIKWILNFLSHLFLVQSWIPIPHKYFDFNGSMWFLSTYIFLTLCTPLLMNLIKKISKTKYKRNIILILCTFLSFIISIVYVYVINKLNINNQFYLYVFPPSRLFEYFIGLIIGSVYILNKDSLNNKNKTIHIYIYTLLECLVLVVLYLFVYKISNLEFLKPFFSYRLNLYIIPLVFCFCIFYFQKGLISKILNINIFVYLGKISMWLFIIHGPIKNLLFRNSIHNRYMCLYVLIIVIICAHLINNYFDMKHLKEAEKVEK